MIDKGDIVIVDFKGAIGREQMGARPALVLSPKAYHEISETAIVAPITSNMGEWSFKVFLDEESPIKGAILVDQIKSLDRANRGFKKIATAPRQIVEKVDSILQQLLQLD